MSDGPLSVLSRRRFLKLGLIAGGGALALAGGGIGGALALRGEAPDVAGLRLLSPHAYRTMRSIARTHLPQGGAFAFGADDADFGRAFDNYLADEPQENIDDLQLALTLVELGPVLFDRRLTTFSNLDDKTRLSHWESWATSDSLIRRQVSLGLRKFMNVVFFDTPQVWAGIGYPGPSLHGKPPVDDKSSSPVDTDATRGG